MKTNHMKFFGTAILLLSIFSCKTEMDEKISLPGDEEQLAVFEFPEPIERDFDTIEKDTLRVLAAYNSTGYFVYRGKEMGYEYDLLKKFAEDNDLELKIIIVENNDSIFVKLNEGLGDIAAARIVPTDKSKRVVLFSDALYFTKPNVVQPKAKPKDVELSKAAEEIIGMEEIPSSEFEISGKIISRPSDLAGKQVTLKTESPYKETLIELNEEISGDIEIVELKNTPSSEEIIRGIASGQYELTVAQENVAKLKASYFSNLLVTPTVGTKHIVSWAVRRNSRKLLDTLDAWIQKERNGTNFDDLYKKYFLNRRGYRERTVVQYFNANDGELSQYDSLIKNLSNEFGWDWRLIASQVYQESSFQPFAESWAGAVGLLQLMPATAAEVGVENRFDPEDNLRGGIKYLNFLNVYWKNSIRDKNERLKFALASYNVGLGHVEDARRLAEKYGDNKYIWTDVAYWLMQKSKRKYYEDPVVKYGFARGLEPVTYVSKILERYKYFKKVIT